MKSQMLGGWTECVYSFLLTNASVCYYENGESGIRISE